MKKQLYSLGDVAETLSVPRHRIVYVLESGRVPEPQRLGGRRVFTEADVSAIARALDLEANGVRERSDDHER
jgi:DNA-binding transcriptional MerR regulator